MASVIRPANAARNTPPAVIEGKGTLTTRSLEALSIVLVLAALGLYKFLFRGSAYAKRVLAFGAMRRSQRPPDHVRAADFSWRPRNQVEADPGVASTLESVKKALATIEEAEAEMASSRQLRTTM
jgi:hypothetical protein